MSVTSQNLFYVSIIPQMRPKRSAIILTVATLARRRRAPAAPFAAIDPGGHAGRVGTEYHPRTPDTRASLGWMR
ncbi:MAG: hypothetical protein KDK02_02825 [Rhodobacteraceae bacterium]|nr:hypothetical protein [Paracoccaceae bacterium]